METAEDICSQEEPCPLAKAKFRGQLRWVGGRGEEQRMVRQARTGASSSCVTAVNGGREEGLRTDTTVPSICGALGLF